MWVGGVGLATVYAHAVSTIARFGSQLLIALQVVVLGLTIGTSGDEALDPPRWSEPPEDIYALSRQHNVIHIVLDAFPSWIFAELMEQERSTFDRDFAGFSFFADHLGAFPTTRASMPAMLTGMAYRNERAATVNRETSALSRMFHLGVRAARLAQRPIFPERLDENGPRQGFFEHAEYKAVRRHLPRPYQDVLDFAYFSGWRKREILELRWDEVDAAGGVRPAVARAVEDARGACVADLGADCGGAVTPPRDASAGRAAGLHAGGHDPRGRPMRATKSLGMRD